MFIAISSLIRVVARVTLGYGTFMDDFGVLSIPYLRQTLVISSPVRARAVGAAPSIVLISES